VGGQLGFISPFFIPLLYVSVRKFSREKDNETLFLLLPIFFVWMLFFAMSVFKNVNVNWPAFAMLTLPIIMADFLNKTSLLWKKYALFGGFTTGVLLLLIFFPITADWIGFKKVLRPSKDPMARIVGYREMGIRLNNLIDSLNIQNIFIFSDSYHIASEMAFYVKGNPQTYVINIGRRKNQFDLWPGISQFEEKGYDAIYITREPEVQKVVIDGFDQTVLKEKFYTLYRSDTIKIYNVLILRGFHRLKEIKTVAN
jgi:hypothetical protein